MVVYRGSDVKYSWEDRKPMCDYVKEGNETTGKGVQHRIGSRKSLNVSICNMFL